MVRLFTPQISLTLLAPIGRGMDRLSRTETETETEWLTGYSDCLPTCRWVTHLSTNRAQCTETILVETNTLLLSQTAQYAT